MGKIGLVLAPAITLFNTDIAINQTIQELSTDMTISVVGQPLSTENQDSALIFLDGWGKLDAKVLAPTLGPDIQPIVDGELWSVNYNNADLTPAGVAHEIMDLAEERDIDRISVIGNSTGGVISPAAVEDILRTSDLETDLMVEISAPNGTPGLRPDHQNEMAWLYKLISVLPGSEYSSITRWIVDQHFGEDSQQQKGAESWLMADQSFAIANADMKQHFNSIARLAEPGEKPVVVYLGTGEPGYDSMVDDKKSSREICEYVGKAGMHCLVYNVPGAIHGYPEQTPDAYAQTLAAARAEIVQALEDAKRQKELNSPGLFGLAPVDIDTLAAE